MHLPIPLYWFVVHPQINFWRRHQRAAIFAGFLFSFPPVAACLVIFRGELFRPDWPPVGSILVGVALILLDSWIFWRVKRDLGGERLVGKTELSGGGEMVHKGIYARIRHPRYVGSFLAILGACFLAATRLMWIVAAAWLLLTLLAILFEERELRRRFGAAYEAYCRRVPRFLPLGPKPREG